MLALVPRVSMSAEPIHPKPDWGAELVARTSSHRGNGVNWTLGTKPKRTLGIESNEFRPNWVVFSGRQDLENTELAPETHPRIAPKILRLE